MGLLLLGLLGLVLSCPRGVRVRVMFGGVAFRGSQGLRGTLPGTSAKLRKSGVWFPFGWDTAPSASPLS